MSSGSISARLTTDSTSSTATPMVKGNGMMALIERSMSASACAMSRPVGWVPK
jgi:hypothetical protein